jgi:hypothetical protein
VREDHADRTRGAGRGRDQVDRGRVRAPQILVREVEDLLIVRVRMDRRHEAVLDPPALVEHLRHRRDAVGRARGVRDDRMLGGVIVTVVDAEHEGHVRVGGGSRDDHLLRACVEMLLRRRPVGEEPGRLDHDVDAEVGPRKRRRVALGQPLHFVARDRQRATGHFHVFAEAPEHRIVTQQMRHRLDVAEVVERHDLEVSAALE